MVSKRSFRNVGLIAGLLQWIALYCSVQVFVLLCPPFEKANLGAFLQMSRCVALSSALTLYLLHRVHHIQFRCFEKSNETKYLRWLKLCLAEYYFSICLCLHLFVELIFCTLKTERGQLNLNATIVHSTTQTTKAV